MKARLSLCFLALIAAGCECGPKTQSRLPRLELPADDGSERTAFDFGQVQVGATTSAKIQVRNGGAALLTISDASTAAPFGTVASELPLSVAPGEVGTLTVTFAPTVADKRETGTLTLTADDPNRKTATITLNGTGITAVATASPTPLAFGDVYVNETKTVALTITNAGSNALDVQQVTFNGTPPSVSANLQSLVGSIAGGMSKTLDVTWAPTAEGPLSGSLRLTLPASQGALLDVPITGRGTQAIARMCFKFDDTGVETCADATNAALTIQVGSLCDNRLYGSADAGSLQCTTATGQRSGKLYYRNDGNVPVKYSLQYQPLPYSTVRCDGGSGQSDFIFSNAPVLADGGQPGSYNVPTYQLPQIVTDPKPWETAQISVTYRASSICREDAADQARVLWTRQGEPVGTNRPPGSMFVTFIGGSKLPRGLPADLAYGSTGSPATVPFPQDFTGVVNAGDAPLVVNAVELWEELPNPFLDAGVADAGGPNGGIFQICSGNLNSDCARFAWSTDGGDPNLRTPFVVDAGTATTPLGAVMGKLVFAPFGSGACVNNGVACPNQQYKVYAVIYTNDPYAPVVYTKVTGVAQ